MTSDKPSTGRIITMVLFTLSCVGLLLFLWLSFGGTIPFNPQGYEFRASFPNAGQLATQADVRIAGVSVGRVISKSLDPQGNRTIATIQLDNKYAPIHEDARAILRTKTILGETYVELTPGTRGSPLLPDGGLLARGQVQGAVQLSDILNAFDPQTRHAFQVWQQQLALALRGNGQNLNSVLGNLPAFTANANDVVRVLDIQHVALRQLVHDGGTVFAALSHNRAALHNLITTADQVFATTAANNNALADTFHVFPTFLIETRLTMARLKSFALDADPVVRALIPVAQNLGPTAAALAALSPDLQRLFVDLGPLITVSETGFPAVRDVLRGATPLLGALGPFLEELNPILNWLSLHQQLISDFISQGATAFAAKTALFGGNGLTCPGLGGCGHYLRQFPPTGADTAKLWPNRPPNDRGNTYPPPLWATPTPLNFSAGGNFPGSFTGPAWDCKNTGGPHAAEPKATPPLQACWVAPPLPGATPFHIPHITRARYSSK